MGMPQYSLEGYGSKTKEAEHDLKSKESELLQRLGQTELLTEKILYVAYYKGKAAKKDSLTCPEFTIQTGKGWDVLPREAEKRANGGALDSYDTRFTLQKFYSLSDDQYALATGRHTSSTPAGGDLSEIAYEFSDFLKKL